MTNPAHPLHPLRGKLALLRARHFFSPVPHSFMGLDGGPSPIRGAEAQKCGALQSAAGQAAKAGLIGRKIPGVPSPHSRNARGVVRVAILAGSFTAPAAASLSRAKDGGSGGTGFRQNPTLPDCKSRRPIFLHAKALWIVPELAGDD